MIEKLANITKWKKWLLIAIAVLSFALWKSIDVSATSSVNGIFLSLLLFLAMGFFYWLVFEVLIGFLYSGLKFKIEKNISLAQFNNIFRIFIIFFNILIYFLSKLIIFINFYSNFLLLITYLLCFFVYFIIVYIVLKKYFLKDLATKQLSFTYFGFGFMYCFLATIMWGVL